MTREPGNAGLRAPVVAGLVVTLAVSGAALGHCDTMDGPVVKDARTALEKGDVTGVLKWIPSGSEEEVRAAFAKTLAVRTKGQDAKELADMYFFETVVRLHRAGEGEPYTGLKPAGQGVSPIVADADKALEQGNVDDLAKRIASAVESAIRRRFAEAAEARTHKDESVEAGRKFVAAYVRFVHFVESIHQMLEGDEGHHVKPGPEGAPSAPGGTRTPQSHAHPTTR